MHSSVRLMVRAAVLLAGLFGVCALCVPATSAGRGGGGQTCGGILEIPCPDGYVCIYDPMCDDCSGVCKRQRH